MAINTNIDEIDIKILRCLQNNGRQSINDLSEAVGLSATPVARRVKQLEQSGVISGYCALVDEAKLGFDVSVFVSVQLDKQVDNALATFEKTIKLMPEVVDCWLMTGNRDYLLKVVTSGLDGFEQFLVGRLTKIDGVASIESSIPLRRVKAGITRTP